MGELCDEWLNRCFDQDLFLCDGMVQGKGLGLKKHAAANAELFAHGQAFLCIEIAKVSDDGMAGVEKVAADLMKTPGVRLGLKEGKIALKLLEDFKRGLSGLFRVFQFFSKRELASP